MFQFVVALGLLLIVTKLWGPEMGITYAVVILGWGLDNVWQWWRRTREEV